MRENDVGSRLKWLFLTSGTSIGAGYALESEFNVYEIPLYAILKVFPVIL